MDLDALDAFLEGFMDVAIGAYLLLMVGEVKQ
jgi:hypothetical protein